jgi:hypothetical protein
VVTQIDSVHAVMGCQACAHGPPVVERTEKAVGDDQGETLAMNLKVQTHDREMLQGASETFTRLP